MLQALCNGQLPFCCLCNTYCSAAFYDIILSFNQVNFNSITPALANGGRTFIKKVVIKTDDGCSYYSLPVLHCHVILSFIRNSNICIFL